MSRYYRDGAADPAFAGLMVALAESLGQTITEARIRIYAQLLGDLPMEELAPAFRRAANERVSSFYPTVGELRRFALPTEEDAALLAWTALGQAVRLVGAYQAVQVEDAAAAEALKAVFGSWPAFCALDEGPTLALKRQEFMAAYRQAARHRERHQVALLPGLCGDTASDPQAALAAGAWHGRVAADGTVSIHRGELGDGDRHARPALRQGADAAAGAGQGHQGGAAGGHGGAGAGGGA